MNYGLIQILVISDCKVDKFYHVEIKDYLGQLVKEIGMKIADIPEPYSEWVDHDNEEDFKRGVSANLYIETSNISVHACDPQKTIRVCIFTCKEHDLVKAMKFSEDFWKGTCIQNQRVIVK